MCLRSRGHKPCNSCDKLNQVQNCAPQTRANMIQFVAMSEIANQLPADIEALHALVVAVCAERDAAIAERDRALSHIDRLRHLLRQLQRAHFGKRSEKLDPDQLLLALEDIEQAIAEREAHDDKKDAIAAKTRTEKRPGQSRRVTSSSAEGGCDDCSREDTNCPCCRRPCM